MLMSQHISGTIQLMSMLFGFQFEIEFHYRKAVTATVFLLPLFGLHWLLTLYRPQTGHCLWISFYKYLNVSLDGLQGLMVAIAFCYRNGEVRNLFPNLPDFPYSTIYQLLQQNIVTHHISLFVGFWLITTAWWYFSMPLPLDNCPSKSVPGNFPSKTWRLDSWTDNIS